MENEFDWASWLKAERLAKGWAKRKVARKSGVLETEVDNLQTVLYRVELGKVNLSMRTLILISRAFSLLPKDIFSLANAPFVYPTGEEKFDRNTIGAFVKTRRKRLGYNLEKLSEQIEFTLGWLSLMERSFPIKINVDRVIELDRVLRCDGVLTGLSWALVENELKAHLQK